MGATPHMKWILIFPVLLATHLPVWGADQSPCLADAFMDVKRTAGPGNGHARPRLEVQCEDGVMIVSSNAIPHYEFVQITPNPLVELNQDYRLPLRPELAEKPSPLPLFGPAGVAINGIPIFGPNEGPVPPPGFGDPVYNAIMDACMGHTARRYHYHALVQSCFETAARDGEPSPILAFAADGFPVYGPFGCADAECSEVIEFKSSWDQLRSPEFDAWDAHRFVPKAGREYLDRCNGHSGDDHGGAYHYHATATWPYILGCFSGTASLGLGRGSGRPDTRGARRGRQPQADPRPSPDQISGAAAELGIDPVTLAQALGLDGERVVPVSFISAARALNIDYPTLSRAFGVEPQFVPTRRGPGPRGREGRGPGRGRAPRGRPPRQRP